MCFHELEFMKKIVVWAIALVTVSIFAIMAIYLIRGSVPSEVVTLVGTIGTGTIVSYATKAGFENCRKYKPTVATSDNNSSTASENNDTTSNSDSENSDYRIN